MVMTVAGPTEGTWGSFGGDGGSGRSSGPHRRGDDGGGDGGGSSSSSYGVRQRFKRDRSQSSL